MNVEVNLTQILTTVGAFFGAGGGFAFFRPFAERAFNHWLTAKEREQKAVEDRQKAAREDEVRTLVALEKGAATQERMVNVLERLAATNDRIDARLDRVESHLGVPMTPSAIPAAQQKVDPRASITGEHLHPPTEAQLAAVSGELPAKKA